MNIAELPTAIKQYLKNRGIWQTRGGHFTLNDEVSLQIRRDTLMSKADEKHRIGI